jgi:hypothetical protein
MIYRRTSFRLLAPPPLLTGDTQDTEKERQLADGRGNGGGGGAGAESYDRKKALSSTNHSILPVWTQLTLKNVWSIWGRGFTGELRKFKPTDPGLIGRQQIGDTGTDREIQIDAARGGGGDKENPDEDEDERAVMRMRMRERIWGFLLLSHFTHPNYSCRDQD